MSFILDALKKSEAERQRRAGPALLGMRLPNPRRHIPAWVWIAGAALFLALNALVLHSPYGFAFSVAGAVIGFFVGSRRLVAS